MLKVRLYYDKDEEEQWLNEMAASGWEFKKFFLGFYTFEPCEPGYYQYQIDLLKNWSGEKTHYTAFMEEVGVNVIAQWWRWVYLQKKVEDGPFEMYTDAESKIAQYRSIMRLFMIVLLIEVCCFFIELNATIRTGSFAFGLFTVLIGAIIVALGKVVFSCKRKIKELEQV